MIWFLTTMWGIWDLIWTASRDSWAKISLQSSTFWAASSFTCHGWVPALALGCLLNRLTVPRSPMSGACFWIETWKTTQCLRGQAEHQHYHNEVCSLSSIYSLWCKLIPPDHWGSGRSVDSNPLGASCPGRCPCSLSPQRCRHEETRILQRDTWH